MTVNKRIWSWFDDGGILPAILGDGEYFCHDKLQGGGHNQLLVMSQLALWARDRGEEALATHSLHEAIKTAIDRSDLEGAFRTVWRVLLGEHHFEVWLAIDLEPLRADLAALLQKSKAQLAENEEVANLVSAVQAHVPGLV